MIDQFVKMTMLILANQGVEGFLPTIVDPDKKEIRAIQDVPASVQQTEAVQKAIKENEFPEHFLFAVRSDATEVTVGECRSGECEFRKLTLKPNGWVSEDTEKPLWWNLQK